MNRSPTTSLKQFWHSFRSSRAGVAALEFAIAAPVLCLILAGTMDLGLVLYVRFGLNQNVSAAANYAIVSASSVSSSQGATLVTNLTSIIPSTIDTTVIVNNGPQVQRTGGASTSSGTAGNADLCYCPSVSGSTVTWGSSVTCGSTCASGTGLGGKFVSLVASTAYTPLFSTYGMVQNGTVSVNALVQVK